MKTRHRKSDGSRNKLLALAFKPRVHSATVDLPPKTSIETEFQAALAHHHAGRLADAERIYRGILAVQPCHADVLHLCGVVHAQTGRFDAAAELIGRALDIKPSAAFYRNFANALRDSGQLDRAVLAFREAIRFEPGDAELHNRLGAVLLALGQFDEAIAACRETVRIHSRHAEAWNNLGLALAGNGQLDEAINAFRRSIDIQMVPQSWNNLGNVLKRKDLFDEAIEAYRVALRLAPDSAEICNNLGLCLRDNGLLEEAIGKLDRAVLLKPDVAFAHWNLSLALLQHGDLLRGWAEYEWRWRWKDYPTPPRNYSRPQWLGEELNGRTVLVHLEQGRGDAIQFIRYAPLIAARGGQVILHCAAEIARLFKGVAGINEIVSSEQAMTFDLHAPLLSLPLAFGTTVDSIPANVPYIEADPDLAAAWGKRLGQFDKLTTGPIPRQFRVGLVWAGNPGHGNDKNRSITLAQLAPLSRVCGITFFTLQKGDAAAQAANPPAEMELIDLTAELHDFADTAAMISHLDLIITVDTAVAHLAGAMGRKVWVLLPAVPDWRWLVERDDTPWYPTMRLFRQKNKGDWAGVIEGLTQRLVAERMH
jgi:tetratricopeptide (TPR) repeat protein